MVEQYLGKEAADSIFLASVISGLVPEDQIEKMASDMEKDAAGGWATALKYLAKAPGAVTDAVGTIYGGGEKLVGGAEKSVGILLKLMAAGALTGALGSTAYDVLKERVSQEDPEAKFNTNVEAMYANRKRELEDSSWMNRIRTMRDELKRGYKKMPTEEYSTKYKALMDALDERKG